METVPAFDGADIRIHDEGHGSALLIVGPGLDDGTRTRKLAAVLAGRFRVLRLHRRQYRLDLKVDGKPCTVAQEVDDVLAIARHVGEPLLVYGHSSGGVVALEALVASPAAFRGAVVFEPASVTDTTWGGAGGEVAARARAALATGRPDKAMAIFTRDATGHAAWQAWAVGVITALMPRYRRLVSCRIDDLDAMNELGNRLSAYADVTVPTLLLGGDRSPARLTAVLDALAAVMPDAERATMPGKDHGADVRSPGTVARVIERFADDLHEHT